jgi:hypothetical protein
MTEDPMLAQRLMKQYDRAVWGILRRVRSVYGGDRIEQEELRAQADLLFMRAVRTWDPAKSGFLTYMSTVLRNGLIKYLMKNPACVDASEYPTLVSPTPSPFQVAAFHDLFRSLSGEAKDVARIILDTPSELVEVLARVPPRKARSEIRRYLLASGWEQDAVRGAFSELKRACSSK